LITWCCWLGNILIVWSLDQRPSVVKILMDSLSPDDLAARLKDRAPSHYLDLYNVMKGVTLGVAGLAFLNIALPTWSTSRFVMWLVAFVGAVLTYYGVTVGAVLINVRPSLPAIALPMLLSVAERVLIYRPGLEVDHGGMPNDWFAALAAWEILAATVIISVSSRLKSGAYDDALRKTIADNRRRLRVDWCMALSSGSVTLIVSLLWATDTWPASSIVKYAFLALTVLTLFGGINSQAKASAEIAKNLERARQGQPPS
jgi:hypothetical protein